MGMEHAWEAKDLAVEYYGRRPVSVHHEVL